MQILYSFAFGGVVGVCYVLIGLRSPAPPVIALIGLLGMLGGELAATQVMQLTKSISQKHLRD